MLLSVMSGVVMANDNVGSQIYNNGLHGQRACVECHLKSGKGMPEGNVIVLPINYKSLSEQYNGIPVVGRETIIDRNSMDKAIQTYLQNTFHKIPSRPGYTESTIKKVIKTGIDPASRKLNPIMPTFSYNDNEIASLIEYLKSMDAQPLVGVTSDSVNIVSIITDSTNDYDKTAFDDKLKEFFTIHNSQGNKVISDFRKISYNTWKLTGPTDTWSSQLEEYYKNNPPFMIVGGFADNWQPIQDFSESHKVPTLLPITNVPGKTPSTYTFYWNEGLYGEGMIAGDYVTHQYPTKSVSIIGDQDNDYAVGAKTVLKYAANNPVSEVIIPTTANVNTIKALLRANKIVVVSATLLGDGIHEFDDQEKKNLQIVYPYWIPQPDDTQFKFRLPRFGATMYGITADQRVTYKANTIKHLLGDMFTRFRGDFTSNHVIDVIGTIMIGGEMNVTDDSPYEHISFSTKTRFIASKPQIVKLTAGNHIEISK